MIREATRFDIEEMHEVRNSVRENRLSSPDLINYEDYIAMLTTRGKGWVCLMEIRIVGFSVVDVLDKNVWALFVHPLHENKGIGTSLHNDMLNWYFSIYSDTLWLSTAPGTKAETFYRNLGWMETGKHGSKELKFEMTRAAWSNCMLNNKSK